MTFFPPASGSGPYLMFGAGALSTTEFSGASVLQSTDLQNFTFATSLGYPPLVMTPPVQTYHCDPTYDTTSFDENYTGPGFVGQDPTLPPGNLVMLYEAENQCPGGVSQNTVGPALVSVGFARSSDNGKTWPPPPNVVTGGPSRYPALQGSLQVPSAVPTFTGWDLLPAGFIDKSLDGNNYLYAAYSSRDMGPGGGGQRVARAKLGQDPVSFQKWYNGSFSQPGIGGLDTDPTWNQGSQACPVEPVQASIDYVDDIGLYLVIFQCRSSSTAYPWYYSTATSLDLQDWTPAQPIQNAQFPLANVTVDGFELSFMSPGLAPGHLHLTGNAFYQTTLKNGTRTLQSRTFTITTQPQPAPVLTSGSLANGATYVAGGLVPGSWAQVQGTGLANTTRIWAGFDFLKLGNALPTSLSGVQVMVSNTPAAVYYISPTQVNFQVPTGISGTASVQVIVNGSASNTISASAAASSPGLFPYTVKGVNYPASVHASGCLVGPSSVGCPAQTGNFIELFATGLTSATGGIVPTAQQINGVTVTIGNVTVPATYAGQTAAVGEYQINFQVPSQFANMPAGNYPISISLNGVSSPTTINSNPPGPIVLPVTP
jgi:uncharacterized protein (TIGR03437 family)